MQQHDPDPIGPLLTVSEVAESLRVSAMTVYRLIRAGDLPAVRVGKSYRIDRDELSNYLHRGTVTVREANG